MKRTTTAAVVMIVALICAFALASCARASAEQPRSDNAEQLEVSDVAVEPTTTDVVDVPAQDADETEEQAEEPEEPAEESCYSDSEPIWDGDYYEEYYEPVYEYSGGYSGSEATTLHDLLNGQGRAYDASGQSYTYYGDVCGHLDIPGENVDENGVIHDGDGYIVVAADSYERGAIIETPYGEAKNYDSGGGYGNVDIYCDLR